MKVPKSLEGRMVAVQLARPVYVFEYAAHIVLEGVSMLVPKMMLAPAVPLEEAQNLAINNRHVLMKPVMRDLLEIVQVKAVHDDCITVEMLVPLQNQDAYVSTVHKTIPSALIVSIDEVVQHEMPAPTLTQMVRQPAESKPLVALK